MRAVSPGQWHGGTRHVCSMEKTTKEGYCGCSLGGLSCEEKVLSLWWLQTRNKERTDRLSSMWVRSSYLSCPILGQATSSGRWCTASLHERCWRDCQQQRGRRKRGQFRNVCSANLTFKNPQNFLINILLYFFKWNHISLKKRKKRSVNTEPSTNE